MYSDDRNIPVVLMELVNLTPSNKLLYIPQRSIPLHKTGRQEDKNRLETKKKIFLPDVTQD